MRILIHPGYATAKSLLLAGILALYNEDVEVEVLKSMDQRLTMLEIDRYIVDDAVYRRTLEGEERVDVSTGWLKLHGAWQIWLVVEGYKEGRGVKQKALSRLASSIVVEPDAALLGVSLAMEFIQAYVDHGSLLLPKQYLEELEWNEMLDVNLRELISVFVLEQRDRD